jgi:hypothetical protein
VIPASAVAIAAQAEGAREVEDAPAARDERRGHVGRGILGQGQKDDLVDRKALEIVRLDRAVPQTQQGWQRPFTRGPLRPHGGLQRHVRVPGQQADQLLPRISRRSRNPDRMHPAATSYRPSLYSRADKYTKVGMPDQANFTQSPI